MFLPEGWGFTGQVPSEKYFIFEYGPSLLKPTD